MMRLRPVVGLLAGLVVMSSSAAMAQGVSASDAKLHARLLTLDTHLDTPANLERGGFDIMRAHPEQGPFSQVDVPRMRAGGLDGGFWVIFTPQGPLTAAGYAASRDAAIGRAVKIREMVAANPQTFVLATKADEAAPIAAAGKIIVYQSIENSYPLGEDIGLLKTFYGLGVRMASPVHTLNNQFGDSATDPVKRWNGLSPLGQAWLAEANRLGIIVDGSHASDDVIDQLVAQSRTPIILSHHGAKAVFAHPRNLDDERLKKVAASGGVIQINSLYVAPTTTTPEFRTKQGALRARLAKWSQLTPAERTALSKEIADLDTAYPNWRASFEDVMANLLHVLKLVGPDHVGLGADWDGGGGVKGMESVADLPKITARLRAAGYSEADLQKIWSGNLLRLLTQADAYRESLVTAPTK